MKIYTIGGSRNIGYFASVHLLHQGATVTFLLRDPSIFDSDSTIQDYIKKGMARLVKGDALSREDVHRGWAVAAQPAADEAHGQVDVLLFTVGGTPRFNILRGFVVTPPDLCTRSLLNALCTIPGSALPPRIVAVTAAGLSPAARGALPLPIHLMYSLLLRPPHADKEGMEVALAHCMGQNTKFTPPANILPAGWTNNVDLPPRGALSNIVIVRPTILTDGECRAQNHGNGEPYRVRSEAGSDLPVEGSYTVSRRDVGHFIGECLLKDRWDEYKGKGVSIGY